MAKKADPWWKNPVAIISGLVGCFTFFGIVYHQVAADVEQKRDIQEHAQELEKVEATLSEHDQAIEQTERQYMMIQQTLGGMAETLKEMKGKR